MILRLFLFSRLVPDFCDGRRSFQTNWKLKFVSSGTSAMDFAHYQSPKLLGSSPPITQVSIFGALSISGQIHRENPRGGGGTRDFKWRGWSKDFWGFEIFDSGIFLGTKIWFYSLCSDPGWSCLELYITLLLKQNRSWVSLAPAPAC